MRSPTLSRIHVATFRSRSGADARWLPGLAVGFVTLCATVTVALAQTVPARSAATPADDAITELSPFVISATADIGYVGAQSLLGSRFKQELRDIPAQIEVFTPEFLLDFDLTHAEDAFKYSVNVENSAEFISPADGGSVAWNSQTNGRIRGLLPSSLSVSRELFSSITTADSYNLDRVELASGAQSLLFSLGEPAGMANMSLKRAQMRDSGQVMMRLDTESGHRMTLDYNKVLYKKAAALRFAFVNENRPQFIKPSHDRNSRVYGALTLQPFRDTTVRLHAERVWEDSNRPVTHLPFDWATPYFLAKQSGTLASLTTVGMGSVQQSPMLIYGANTAPVSYTHWRLQVGPAGPQKLALDPAKYGAALDPNSGATRVTFNPENINLIPAVAASVGKNFLGENLRNKLDSRIFDVILEQRITDNLRVEAGAHSETWDKRLEQLAGYIWFGYYADVNEYIPIVPYVTSTVAPDFRQNLPVNQFYVRNPNYGKLFVHGGPSLNKSLRETEEYRGSVAWDPDLRRFWKPLGRHSLLGSYSTRTTSGKSQTASVRMMNPVVNYQSLRTLTPNDARRVLQTAYYIDAQHPTVTQPLAGQVTFDQLYRGFNYTEPTTGEVLKYQGWDAPVAATPAGSKSKIDSGILAWQARFLDDRVNLGYGLRRDNVKSYKLNPTQVDGVTFDKAMSAWYWYEQVPWNVEPSISQSKTSHTYGGVVRPLRWLSLSYYESATFSLATGNFTPFGEPLPGVEGKSQDFGLRVDFLGGRLFLKVNLYEVTQVGGNVSGSLPIDAKRLEEHYRAVADDKANRRGTPNYDQLLVQEGFAGGMTGHTQTSTPFVMTGDTLSKGWELTAGTRLGRLDVRLTGAKIDAKTGNVADTWQRWIEARKPFWEKLVDANGLGWDKMPYQGSNPENFIIADPVTGQRRVMTMQEFYQNVVVTDLAVSQASNGKPVDTGRKYRANCNLAYSFAEGRLRGIRIGGALVYRSAPVVGFPVKPLAAPGQAFPIPILNYQSPYYGNSDFNVDAFVAYSGRNFLGSRKAWRLQVNGSNLLTGESSFRTGKVNAFGQSIFTVIETPRAASATLSFEF